MPEEPASDSATAPPEPVAAEPAVAKAAPGEKPQADDEAEKSKEQVPSATAKPEEELKVGKEVEVVGTAMNGSVGIAEEFMESKSRWKVKFSSGVTKNFKPENLRVAKATKGDKQRTKRPKKEAPEDEEEQTSSTSKGDAKAARKGSLQVGGVAAFLEIMRKAPGPAEEAETRPATTKVTATEAPQAAEETKPSGAVSTDRVVEEPEQPAEPPKPINLAGKTFADKDALVAHIREMQKKLEEKEGGILEGEDMFLVYHMLMKHPGAAQKIVGPVKSIRYGSHHLFPSNKCFILVFSDGTEEQAVGWMKCVRELFSMKQPSRGKKNREGEGEGEGKSNKKRRKDAEAEQFTSVRGEKCAAEESREATGLRLLRELAAEQKHQLAERWEYPMMDETKRCFAGYMKCPVEQAKLDGFFKSVESGTTWGQPIDPRSGEPIPRKTAWMTDGFTCTYRYGGVDVEPQSFPPWMYEIMEAYMPICGLTSREDWPNSCNLNLYEDGSMSVGWHSDDEKLFDGRFNDIRIISVTLGEARTFELREIGIEEGAESRNKYKMRLGDGDLCTMEGLTQKHYQHRVPKEEATGRRINLTWRWVVKRFQKRKEVEA